MKHAPGVICRVKPPKNIPKYEYDQTNERIVVLVRPMATDGGLKGWKIDPALMVHTPLGRGYSLDSRIDGVAESCLVPIDPGSGQDEILRITALPHKETA